MVHSIDNRDGKNASRETNKALNGKAQTSMDSNEFEQQTSEDSHELQSRMLGSGIPMSEERYTSINSPKRMLQDGGHYGKLPRNQPRIEDSEDSEGDERYTNLHEQELMEKQIDTIYGDLKAKKRRILDNVLDRIPDHLQTRAKRICDSLKGKDRLFILPDGALNIDGETLRGSNIHNLVMQELLEPPTPGCIQFKLLEDENKTLEWLLRHIRKEFERERGFPICTKFESMFDGTVEYFDSSDDANSDENGTNENEEDEEDSEDETEDDEDETEEDEAEEEDEEDVPKKRKL